MSSVTIYIGTQTLQTTPGLQQGKDLHQLADISPPQQLAVTREGAIDIPIGVDDYIVVQHGDHFVIGDGDLPLPDNPCLRTPIPFCVNNQPFPQDGGFQRAKILGSELKKLASEYQPGDGLFAEIAGYADEPIRDDMRVILQDRDKFITVPCGNVGEQASQPKIVPLPEQFVQVKHTYPKAELIQNGKNLALIIPELKLPQGWLAKTADLMIQIPQSYPLAALDMFWLSPEICLPGGQLPERGNVKENHFGKTWQRFSWHYPPARPWDSLKHSLLSHIRFCFHRLNQIK